MKVIDLFNKGANGEEMPEKIKYNGEIYYLNDGNYSTYNKYGYLKRFFQWEWSLFEHLNDEVEITEEDNGIENNFQYVYDCDNDKINANFENIRTTLENIIKAINEMREDN